MSRPKTPRNENTGLRTQIVRLWGLVELLHTSPRGLSNAQLEQRLGVSRATFYRDLTALKSAGVPLTRDKVNGEVRHRLEHRDLPALNPTPLQLLALRVARSMLAPLEGMRIVRELDALLRQTGRQSPETAHLHLGGPRPPASPNVTALVERSLQERRRLGFAYQSPSGDQASHRTVDPLGLRVVEGHIYLIAFDLDKQAARTFKLLRMQAVDVLSEPATPHPEVDEDALFADSVKAWAGDSHEVIIKIPARLIGVAGEWPLITGQTVHDQGDGDALVQARVAGLVEAMRWVLRWGADAEVVEPAELRRLVASELGKALEFYRSVVSDG